MSVKGRFGIDVQFTDSTTESGVQSLKSLTLSHASEYDGDKVAILSGTCGTATVTIPLSPTTYRNAAGTLVSFASVSRVAFSATGAKLVALDGIGGCGVNDWTIYSRANQIAVSEAVETSQFTVNVFDTAGTAAFTLILYGA